MRTTEIRKVRHTENTSIKYVFTDFQHTVYLNQHLQAFNSTVNHYLCKNKQKIKDKETI